MKKQAKKDNTKRSGEKWTAKSREETESTDKP